MKNQIKIALSFLIFGFFTSCNAPHLNPFDPNNDDKTLAELSGTIKSVKIPSMPIEGVTVYWSGSSMIATTDINGNFSFEDIPQTDGYIYFEKDGYAR